jgi:hypothetical protein
VPDWHFIKPSTALPIDLPRCARADWESESVRRRPENYTRFVDLMIERARATLYRQRD